ncbi:MAG: nucleotidyltransferase domain-containing protein [Candidatus Methanosuratincola sp.]
MPLSVETVNSRLFTLATDYSKELLSCLGDELVSVVLFGSVARGEASASSDVDLFIVIRDLPKGRFVRKERLRAADQKIAPALEALWEEGIDTSFCRILKTPEEAERIVPIYLDLVEDAVFLVDKGDFLRTVLSNLRRRLQEIGARRLTLGKIRYWDLKPDFKPLERFTI